MKNRGQPVVVLVLVLAALAACGGHSQRSNWRHPARVCAADTECPSGNCSMELGASQGTCTPSNLPELPPPGQGTDGGARPPGPAPSIQPSSTDIRI